MLPGILLSSLPSDRIPPPSRQHQSLAWTVAIKVGKLLGIQRHHSRGAEVGLDRHGRGIHRQRRVSPHLEVQRLSCCYLLTTF